MGYGFGRDIACQPKVWNSIEGGASFIKGSLFRRTNWRGPLLPPVCVVPLSLPEFSDFDIMCFLLVACLRRFLYWSLLLSDSGVLSHPSFAQDWLSCHVSWSFSSLLEIGYCMILHHCESMYWDLHSCWQTACSDVQKLATLQRLKILKWSQSSLGNNDTKTRLRRR